MVPKVGAIWECLRSYSDAQCLNPHCPPIEHTHADKFVRRIALTIPTTQKRSAGFAPDSEAAGVLFALDSAGTVAGRDTAGAGAALRSGTTFALAFVLAVVATGGFGAESAAPGAGAGTAAVAGAVVAAGAAVASTAGAGAGAAAVAAAGRARGAGAPSPANAGVPPRVRITVWIRVSTIACSRADLSMSICP